MIVTVVFDPDPSLPPRQGDDATPPDPQAIGLALDSTKDDLLLVFRQYGEQYPGGIRNHVVGTGIWRHVNLRQIGELIESLNE